MALGTLDWIIVGVFFLIVLSIGWAASKTAGKSSSEFFLGGRGMPWWLLGRLHGGLHLLRGHPEPGHRHGP